MRIRTCQETQRERNARERGDGRSFRPVVRIISQCFGRWKKKKTTADKMRFGFPRRCARVAREWGQRGVSVRSAPVKPRSPAIIRAIAFGESSGSPFRSAGGLADSGSGAAGFGGEVAFGGGPAPGDFFLAHSSNSLGVAFFPDVLGRAASACAVIVEQQSTPCDACHRAAASRTECGPN